MNELVQKERSLDSVNFEGLDWNKKYAPPNNTEWIVAVDRLHEVVILKAPDIHPSLIEGCTEEIGLPYKFEGAPGVYWWRCEFEEHTDWETGIVEYISFNPVEMKLLFNPEKKL